MGFWNDGGFFRTVKGHVFKWWQLVIMPVLRINNNNNNNSKMAQNGEVAQAGTKNSRQLSETQDMQMGNSNATVSELSQNKRPLADATTTMEMSAKEKASDKTNNKASGEDALEVLRRINDEKEAKRRQEIEEAKEKASKEAQIAAIMNANKVDVNAFIQAGKAAKEEIAVKQEQDEEKKRQQEELLRVQEIMDRLNREAAEDEAIKQAEIEAARQEAKKQFG